MSPRRIADPAVVLPADRLFGDQADRMFAFETMGVEERREHLVETMEIGRCINYLGTIPAAYKPTWNMMGLPAGHLRDPLKPLTADQEARLRTVLTKWGVLEEERPARRVAS